MNCTYRTNRFKMPSLNIVGSTSLDTTLFVANIFLAKEAAADYLWVMQALKSVPDQPGFTMPSIIVTDCEIALINSVRITFPSMKRLLCVRHVEKNVLSYASTFLGKEDGNKRDEFMVEWALILSAASRIDFEERWDTLFDKYNTNNKDLVWYIKDTWIVFKWNLVRF